MPGPIGGSVVATAVVLGITHGLEPDHVAGITTLTQDTDDPTLSALVGQRTFPPIYEEFGLPLVGSVLAVLGLAIGMADFAGWCPSGPTTTTRAATPPVPLVSRRTGPEGRPRGRGRRSRGQDTA